MKPAAALGLLIAGLASGLAASALHQLWWGSLLAFTAAVAVTFWLPSAWWTRLPYAGGWLLAVTVATLATPDQDLIVVANARGYVLLIATLALVVASSLSVAASGMAARPAIAEPRGADDPEVGPPAS